MALLWPGWAKLLEAGWGIMGEGDVGRSRVSHWDEVGVSGCCCIQGSIIFFCMLRHFLWMYYVPRKRIQGLPLLCVFILLLHGPWCQLRLSVQWNQTDGMGEGCLAIFLDLWGTHQIWGWPFLPYSACLWHSQQFSRPCDHRWFQISQCCHASESSQKHGGEFWPNVVHRRRDGKPLPYSYLENPMNSVKRQKDRTLKDELPRSVGTQYTTGDQWRNNSRKNEEIVRKQNNAQFWMWLVMEGGEGNGTPLQSSCLENPMDGGAWWATVHGVLTSWTRLSDFTFTFHFHALEKAMATHSSVLAWRIPGQGNLMGCCLWGHTESDTTDGT